MFVLIFPHNVIMSPHNTLKIFHLIHGLAPSFAHLLDPTYNVNTCPHLNTHPITSTRLLLLSRSTILSPFNNSKTSFFVVGVCAVQLYPGCQATNATPLVWYNLLLRTSFIDCGMHLVFCGIIGYTIVKMRHNGFPNAT